MPPPARTAKHRMRCGPPAVAKRERIPGFRRRILQSPDEWEGNFPTRKPLIRHKTGKESRSSAVHVLSQSQTHAAASADCVGTRLVPPPHSLLLPNKPPSRPPATPSAAPVPSIPAVDLAP